jgi:WD40 repeat protein
MDDVGWKRLTALFPGVPAQFRMELVAERATAGKPISTLQRPVIALAFSPDSRTIAATGGGMIPGPATISVFDVESRMRTRICHAHVMGVFELAFDPRTGLLVSASHDYSVILWELERHESIFLVGGPDAGISRKCVAFVDTRVVIGDGMTFDGEQAQLHAIDLATGERSTLFELDGDRGVAHLARAPDGLVVVVQEMRSSSAPELRVVAPDGTPVSATPLPSSIYDLAAVDARCVILAGRDVHGNTEVFAVDGRSGVRTASRVLGDEIGAYVAVSPSGDRVAIGYADRVELCDATTLAARAQLPVGSAVSSVAWSPDGRWIAAGTVARTLHLFDAATGREHLG